VLLNHVFDATGEQGVSRVLRGINPFGLQVQIDGQQVNGDCISNWKQTIDMKEAVHYTNFDYAGKADIRYSVYALRNMPYAGLVHVEIEAKKDLYLYVANKIDVPDEYKNVDSHLIRMNVNGEKVSLVHTTAVSKYRGVIVSSSSTFIYDKKYNVVQECDKVNHFSKLIRKGERFSFDLLGTICSDRNFIDPYNESVREIIYGIAEGVTHLIAKHRQLWSDLWKGDIIIEGDDEAQRAVRFALYNLYSSARGGSRLSIPPFGLSSQGYNGHVFWDAEFWMYPPMLFLNQGIAKSMIDYRIDRLTGAYQRAMSYGYRGAMFPWESDDAGEESCPVAALSGPFEHHITADIGIAAWNYYCMSGNKKWLLSEGFPLIREVANFWVSRSSKNVDGSYSVRNVVCADEYAIGVDDNAFTNGAVICSLRNAVKAAAICREKVPAIWAEIADKLRILRFKDGIIKEHASYVGQRIKQADANLIAYPLGLITAAKDIRRDLAYYEDKINKRGPAMSFSILAVQYARLGDGDRAYRLFKQSYCPNQLPPFGTISEGSGGTNPYFVTGAGGMLQVVINGFCGLEITDHGIKQLPSALPGHWKKVIITGVGPKRRIFVRDNRK
jgi:trehalose/maltose hydrolase-like predicted phosphorylase